MITIKVTTFRQFPKPERTLNMATVFDYRPIRGFRRSRAPLLRGLSGRIAAAWQSRRALRELESLSYDLRKDIGFPPTDTHAR